MLAPRCESAGLQMPRLMLLMLLVLSAVRDTGLMPHQAW